MPTGQGVTSKAAFKIENTAWGTSTDCGSGDQIHIISESISHAIEQAQAIHKDGLVGAKNLYPIFKKYGGDLLIEAHYAGIEALIAATMGMSHQDLSPVAVTSTSYEHYFEPSEDMSTRAFNGLDMTTPSGNRSARGTLTLEKTVSVWELASSMVNAMNFEASPERVTFSFTVAGKTLTFDSATNPNSTSWTLPTNTEQIAWEDMSVYLKARDQFTIANATNDVILVDEGAGDITVDIGSSAGTYTGYRLAQIFATAMNASGSLAGNYKMEYDEQTRKFHIFTVNGQTFSISGATMNSGTTLGITADSTTAIHTFSNQMASVDAYAIWASGDKVGISKFTMAYENTLEIGTQDSESSLEILEPERNGFRRVTGSMEIPRYKNDTFLNAVSGYTSYELYVVFSGSAIDSENYELKLHLGDIKFTNVDAPVTGPELIKQTLAFEAQLPSFQDPINQIQNLRDYLNTSSTAAAASLTSIAVGPDGIYVGSAAGHIFIWNELDGTFTTSTDTGATSIDSLIPWGGKMFAGDTAGEIFEQSNGTWASSTDVGTGTIIDFAEYAGSLYALEGSTGKVFVYDQSPNWSLSCDTTSTDANALIEYGGSLWMIGSDGSTFTRAYKFDGTTWTTSCDFGSGTAVQAAAIYDGKLYVAAATELYSYDGSSWTLVDNSTNISPIWMGVWNGLLAAIPTGATADLYYWNVPNGTFSNIDSTLNLTQAQKFTKVIGRDIYMPAGATALKIFKSMKEIMLTIQNQNSTNPL